MRQDAFFTAEQHIQNEQRRNFPHASGEFSWLLSGISLATKVVAAQIRRAGLVDVVGSRHHQRARRDRAKARRASESGPADLPGQPRQRGDPGLGRKRRPRCRHARSGLWQVRRGLRSPGRFEQHRCKRRRRHDLLDLATYGRWRRACATRSRTFCSRAPGRLPPGTSFMDLRR